MQNRALVPTIVSGVERGNSAVFIVGLNVKTVGGVTKQISKVSRHRLALEHLLVTGATEQIGVESTQIRCQRRFVRIPARGVTNSKIIGVPINPVFTYRQSRRKVRTGRKSLSEIIDIDEQRQADLFQVVDTSRVFRLFLGLGESRKEQCRQNCNDGDDHQQFDQRKGPMEERSGGGPVASRNS